MKRSTWMIGIGAALAMLASQATLADNSQQEKMKTCNETASSKNLSGDARKTFMQKCLSHDSAHSATSNSQQEKMKTCNETASSKNLSGDARKTFMQKCLSGTHSG